MFSSYSDCRNSLIEAYVKTMNKNIIKMKKFKKSFVKCLAGKYDAVIWPDGKVSMCEFTKPFADLKNYQFNFYRLWTSKSAWEMRKKICCCFCAHTCNLMSAMKLSEKALMEVFENQK